MFKIPALTPASTILYQLIDGNLSTPEETDFAEALASPVYKCAATHASLGKKLASSQTSVEAALAAANRIHTSKSWMALSISEKQSYFEKVATKLDEYSQDLHIADTIDIGLLPEHTKLFNNVTQHFLRLPIEKILQERAYEWIDLMVDGKKVGRECFLPVGPAVILAPSNAPIGSTGAQIVVALATGCPVIAKPSVHSPHSYSILAKAFHDAGFPAGVFQVVYGGVQVAQTLVKSPVSGVVCFTGSTKAGQHVAASCAPSLKRLHCELGGTNSFIVLKGADLSIASESLFKSMTMLNGSYCLGPSKIFVHEDEKEEFMKAVLDRFSKLKLGHPLDPSTTFGPTCAGLAVALKAEMKVLLSHPGAVAVTANLTLPDLSGDFIQPTIIDNVPSSSQTELFGPVATIHSFKTLEEAIDLTNQATAMIRTYVYGNEEETMKVTEDVQCGWFDVNQFNMGHPGSRKIDFWGLSGCNHLSTELFTRKKYQSCQ